LSERPRILFVCTANQCRSAVAERLLASRLDAAGVEAVVRSAGFFSPGERAVGLAIMVLNEYGLDLSDHRSYLVVPAILDSADLVITMTREHLRAVAVLSPGVWPRSFTLRELVRRAEALPRRAQSLGTWLGGLSGNRATEEMLGGSVLDDVADPAAFPLPLMRAAVGEVDALLERLIRVAWPQTSKANEPDGPSGLIEPQESI
jgi:protein-tyrosine phosphatase